MTSERITAFARHVARMLVRRRRLDEIASIREREIRLRMRRKVLEREVECLGVLIDRRQAQVAIRRRADDERLIIARGVK